MSGRSEAERGQVTGSAAEVYEALFVPALFGQWAPVLVDAAGTEPGDRLLDVACGTGAVAREARRQGATTTGVDVNEGMLAVARRADPEVAWREAAAEDLPFPDGSFDRVTCAFGLMYLADREAALGEVARVLAPGGTVAVATWAGLERSPGFAALVELFDRVLGREAGDALRAPFTIGTPAALAAATRPAFAGAEVREHDGTARFGSLDEWVRTEIEGWTLAGTVDDAALAHLLDEARTALAGFVGAGGTVEFPVPALVAVANTER